MDDLSSAHVYLRLPDGIDLDLIPETTLEDCCQLVKANSIQARVAPSCFRSRSPPWCTSHIIFIPMLGPGRASGWRILA